MRNLIAFTVGLGLAVLFFWAPFVHAQTVGFDAAGNVYGFTPTSGSNVSQANGVNVRSGGNVNVRLPNGSSNVVPININRNITNASIARIAGRIGARAIPVVGAAVVIGELADLLGDQYRPSADGQSLEKQQAPASGSPPFSPTQGGWTSFGACASPSNGCSITQAAQILATQYPGTTVIGYLAPRYDTALNRTIVDVRGRHPQGFDFTIGSVIFTGATQPYVTGFSPATATDIENDLLLRFQNGVSNVDAFDVIRRGESAAAGAWPEEWKLLNAQNPVTVEAPQVSSPPREVGVTTQTRPDGSIDTTTTTETTTIKPTTTGTTAGDVKTTFPTTTTTTSTTTNNVTNTTTTTNTVVNHLPQQSPEPQELDLPEDYNREDTQKDVLRELKAEQAPSLAPDFTSNITETITANRDQLKDLSDQLPNQFNTAKDNWFSWVWTPPIGTCENPSGAIRGQTFTLDICLWVDRIRDAMGWLFALFAAMNIYGLIYPSKGSA